MDDRFWRAEARRLRAEADHLAGLADNLETAAREAMGAPAMEEEPHSPSTSRISLCLILVLIASAMGGLIYFALTK